jgi:hypothetical protein
MNRTLAALTLATLAATACTKSETPVPTNPPKQAQPAGPHSGSDPGIEAMTEHAPSPDAGGILYVLPAGWTRVKPTGKLRMDQASVTGPAGDAELDVFYFGPGSGGGVEANFDMWTEQVDGGTPVRGTFEQGGFKVSWIETAGTLAPSGLKGPREPRPNSRLIGAVVEGAGGPWFFKLTGPDATVAAQKEAFLGMLRAIKADPNAPKSTTF